MHKLGRIIRRAFISALSLALFISPIAHAVLPPEENMPAGRTAEWEENSIVFYNPNSCGPSGGYTQCSGGGDNFEKMVCYFSGSNPFGISLPATGIAGIIANAMHESGADLSPFRNQINGPAYGVFQFDPRSKILDPLQSDSRSAPYFNEWYTPSRDVTAEAPVEVNDAFLFVELDYAVQSEFNTTTLGQYRNLGGTMGLDYLPDNLTILQAMQQAQSASDAARVFIWIYERPADKPGGAVTRSAEAENILPRVEALVGSGSSSGVPNTVSTGANSTATADNGSDITMIGDSLTVGASSLIQSTVPGIDIDASVGRHFSEGLSILQSKASSGSLRKIVVFALGTNDAGGVTSSMAQQVISAAGPDRQVIFVTNFTKHADYTSNNNVFRNAANNNTNVIVADFAGAASADPDKYISSDNIHHTEDGKRLFVETIFSGVTTGVAGNNRTRNNCPGTSNGGGGGLISGGMTLEEAIQFMERYRSIEPRDYSEPGNNLARWAINDTNCAVDLENCVAFVQWFICEYGGVCMGLPDGGSVVGALVNSGHGFTGPHTEPQPYAIFSTSTHTGVVLGIDESSGTIIIGEAGCDTPKSWTTAHPYPLSDWTTGSGVTYAYTDGVIRGF